MMNISLTALKPADRLFVAFEQPSEQSVSLWCNITGIANNKATVVIEPHQECHTYWYIDDRRVSALVRLVKSGEVTLCVDDLDKRASDVVIAPVEDVQRKAEVTAFSTLLSEACDLDSVSIKKAATLLDKLKTNGLDTTTLFTIPNSQPAAA